MEKLLGFILFLIGALFSLIGIVVTVAVYGAVGYLVYLTLKHSGVIG